MKTPHAIAEKLLGLPYELMDARTQKVLRHMSGRKHIARNTAVESGENSTPGQRAADAVARFGGSWTFISLFGVVLVAWVVLNSLILSRYGKEFDPYPVHFAQPLFVDAGVDSGACHFDVAKPAG